MNIKNSLMNLLPFQWLENASADDLLQHLGTTSYKKEFSILYSESVFRKLPRLIQDVYLIVEFDISLQMSGIFGFIENSQYINETIETLRRIGASEDSEILLKIRDLLSNEKGKMFEFRSNHNKVKLFQITTFKQRHNNLDDEVVEKIGIEADNLYLYHNDRNIFDYLLKHIDAYKHKLFEEIYKR
ncbi:hypothetical protein PCCS19_26300 [Paenibacillus sp. CCS19]|uniref:DMP19 family protein n=1 Tax=Paenibacillus sp. CCS19 TaxID=3158387 RepID=UPI00256E2F40|nr:DUF4375 domain-containing protein [Paenibacillus cellulosilyticus]GMK39576.1 hypothetical protein PCCS19_26300 [Paenibacillus cellulosilyticus]